MAFPIIFASLAQGVQPLSDFDTMFNVVGGMGTIFCAATGSNTIALSPGTNMPTVASYTNFQAFGFVAAANSTSVVTINVSGVGALNAYAGDAVTQLGAGSLAGGVYYVLAYNSALNSAAGGFQLIGPQAANNTVNAANGASVVLLATQTASNNTAILFTGYLTSAYLEYILAYQNLLPAGGVPAFNVQVGESGTIKSGNNYEFHFTFSNSAGSSGVTASVSAGAISLATLSNPSATDGGVSGQMRIYNPANAAGYKAVDFTTSGNDGTNYFTLTGGGHWLGDTNAVTDLNFYFTGQSMTSGTLQLYGVRKA